MRVHYHTRVVYKQAAISSRTSVSKKSLSQVHVLPSCEYAVLKWCMLLLIVKEKVALEHSRVSFTPKYLPRGRGLRVFTKCVVCQMGLRLAEWG